MRATIPAELVPLFERVKRGIKASPRMSRTEAFLQYAEENPDEVPRRGRRQKTDALARELEARRAMRRPPQRLRYTPEDPAAVPF